LTEHPVIESQEAVTIVIITVSKINTFVCMCVCFFFYSGKLTEVSRKKLVASDVVFSKWTTMNA